MKFIIFFKVKTELKMESKESTSDGTTMDHIVTTTIIQTSTDTTIKTTTETISTPPNLISTTKSNEGLSDQEFILILSLAGGGLLVLILILLICVILECRRRKKISKKRGQNRTETNDQPATNGGIELKKNGFGSLQIKNEDEELSQISQDNLNL